MAGPNFVQNRVSTFVSQTQSLSPSLLLGKYAQVGKIQVKNHKGKITGMPLRTEAVKAVCKAVPRGVAPPPVWTRRVDGKVFYMTLKSRLMVNMAGGVIENGNLSLHPFTGHPVIPGSAIKGVARHAAWRMWNEEGDSNLKPGLAKGLADIFGCPTGDKTLDEYLIQNVPGYNKDTHHAGSVVFLDAHPMDRAPLEEEILTPHTTNDPKPNVFPAVAAGATFVFAMLPGRRMAGFAPDKREQLWTLAQSWLREALTEDGLGAKTSAGYGWFEENVTVTERLEIEVAKQREQEAEEQREAERLAAMDPVERFREEFLAMDSEPFAHAAKSAEEFDPDQQKALLLAVQVRDGKDWWKKKKKRAKKDPKDQTLVEALRQLAAKHDLELS